MIRQRQPSTLVRAAALLAAAVVAGGCTTYHHPLYVDSGAFYRSAGEYGGYTGGYPHAAYRSSNPVVYPYWSIDYFYFSRHYHPYSVYVGYREPLYNPYPGWALGYYRPPHAHHSAGHGSGYPWHGFEHRYPRFSLGFFARHDQYRHGGHRRARDGRHHDHPIRQIDRRLAELQHRRDYRSRRALLTRRDGRPATRAGGPARSAAGTVSPRTGRRDAARRHSRARLLQARGSGTPGGRVIVNDRGDRQSRRSVEPRRGERSAVRIGTRSIRERTARRGDGHPDRGRRTARPAPDASRSRASVIRRARPAPDRDSHAPQPDRQRTVPTRTTRTDSPPPERATRRASRRSSSSDGHGDGGGASSRRDRLRSRFDGRRRR